jgi:hypothetical protein
MLACPAQVHIKLKIRHHQALVVGGADVLKHPCAPTAGSANADGTRQRVAATVARTKSTQLNDQVLQAGGRNTGCNGLTQFGGISGRHLAGGIRERVVVAE